MLSLVCRRAKHGKPTLSRLDKIGKTAERFAYLNPRPVRRRIYSFSKQLERVFRRGI